MTPEAQLTAGVQQTKQAARLLCLGLSQFARALRLFHKKSWLIFVDISSDHSQWLQLTATKKNLQRALPEARTQIATEPLRLLDWSGNRHSNIAACCLQRGSPCVERLTDMRVILSGRCLEAPDLAGSGNNTRQNDRQSALARSLALSLSLCLSVCENPHPPSEISPTNSPPKASTAVLKFCNAPPLSTSHRNRPIQPDFFCAYLPHRPAQPPH